jgi:hypothetical protein
MVFLIGDGIVKGRVVRGDHILTEAAAHCGLIVESVVSTELRGVSKRFIKTSRLDEKQHHIVTLLQPHQ